jgi:2-amino-4-hydroxy-6-hydroxymethyldihydropteridine diphosphokinase
MSWVYVALGSNLGVSQDHIQTAIEKMRALDGTSSLSISPWYRTAPIGGPDDQPDYINAACKFKTTLRPLLLLDALQDIEQEAGRVREIRWGPRTLDLDIIWFEDETSETEILTLPHPRAHERTFVLQPLLDLNASFLLNNQTLQHWRNLASDQSIAPLT